MTGFFNDCGPRQSKNAPGSSALWRQLDPQTLRGTDDGVIGGRCRPDASGKRQAMTPMKDCSPLVENAKHSYTLLFVCSCSLDVESSVLAPQAASASSPGSARVNVEAQPMGDCLVVRPIA